jgi:hypothetical protein
VNHPYHPLDRHKPPLKRRLVVYYCSAVYTWREEHLFALKQQLANYDHYQQMIRDCDTQLHRHLQTFPDKGDPNDLPPVERAKPARGHVVEQFDLRAELFRICGVDLTRIDSINALTAQTVLAEIGPDLTQLPQLGAPGGFLR